MKLKIHEIYYKNIREMRDLTINLCLNGTPAHISLLQMRNGLGKTTTMDLIRYCLDKKTGKGNPEKIQSMKPPGSNVTSGEFRIKLSIDDRIKYVKLLLDYENSTLEIKTSSADGGGLNNYLDLGSEMDPWLTSSFTRLFVFDGELAGDLLKKESTSAEDAIKALYHLDNLDNLYVEDGVIDDIIQGVLAEEKITSNQGLQNIKTRYINAKKTRQDLINNKNQFEERLKEIKKIIDENDKELEEYRSLDKQAYAAHIDAQREMENLEKNIVFNTDKLLRLYRIPNNFTDEISTNLSSLYTQMGKLKLPKTQSQEFFIELSESPECICGRKIGPDEKKTILLRSTDYLSENNIGVINEIKASLRNLPSRDDFSILITQIKEDNVNRKRREKEKNKPYKNKEYSEKMEKLEEKIAECKIEQNELQGYLNILTESRKDYQKLNGLKWEENIHLCSENIKNLEKQILASSNNLDFKNKADILKEILSKITDKSLVQLKQIILSETNIKIEKILKTKDIKIEKIGNHLTLTDRAGASEGQKLSIAYAFLSTLFSQSTHKFPFIVDTPAAPLDLQKRREVAAILPDLFDQMVVFITSSERDNFADQFYGKNDCLFYTVTDKNNRITINTDIDYFQKYQSKEDD